MNRAELHQIAEMRLAEAKMLLTADQPAGAYYLAGYAVECGLKACIAKRVQQYEFPDKGKVLQSYSHNLAELLKTAELETAFEDEIRANKSLEGNWAVVKDWNERSRYDLSKTMVDARDLIGAISDPENGIFQWLTQHW